MELEDFACITWFDSLNKLMGTAERTKKSNLKMDDITDDCLKHWAQEICQNVRNQKTVRSHFAKQSPNSKGNR